VRLVTPPLPANATKCTNQKESAPAGTRSNSPRAVSKPPSPAAADSHVCKDQRQCEEATENDRDQNPIQELEGPLDAAADREHAKTDEQGGNADEVDRRCVGRPGETGAHLFSAPPSSCVRPVTALGGWRRRRPPDDGPTARSHPSPTGTGGIGNSASIHGSQSGPDFWSQRRASRL